MIHAFLASKLLYVNSERYNCVFIGRNRSGQPVFADKRGTYDRDGKGFEEDVLGSDKFEAPIDLMSYCTLHRSDEL